MSAVEAAHAGLESIQATRLNLRVGALLTAIAPVTIPGSWVFKLFLGIIAIVLPLLAVWYAWPWSQQATT